MPQGKRLPHSDRGVDAAQLDCPLNDAPFHLDPIPIMQFPMLCLLSFHLMLHLLRLLSSPPGDGSGTGCRPGHGESIPSAHCGPRARMRKHKGGAPGAKRV